jgi:hypothetical protein
MEHDMSTDDTTTMSTAAKQAYTMGVQAYIWGYPVVVMQRSRDAMTKGGDAPVTPDQFDKTGKLFAPVNQVASAWVCSARSSPRSSRATPTLCIR